MINRIIRWMLTVLLMIGVYSETGIFTAVAIALIFIYAETTGYFLARTMFVIDGIMAMLFPKDEAQ